MNNKDKSGFTLVEVLIGMSILSIMMLLLFASLRTCIQNWEAGENKLAQMSESAAVQNFLINKLTNSLPLSQDFLEEKGFSFQGENDSLQFVAAMPASASRLGLQLFNLYLKPSNNNNSYDLWVKIQPFYPNRDESNWKDEELIILKQLERFKLRYFGAEQTDEDPTWHDEWMEQEKLPLIINIELTMANGMVWPEIQIPLKTHATNQASGKPTGIQVNPFNLSNKLRKQ